MIKIEKIMVPSIRAGLLLFALSLHVFSHANFPWIYHEFLERHVDGYIKLQQHDSHDCMPTIFRERSYCPQSARLIDFEG